MRTVRLCGLPLCALFVSGGLAFAEPTGTSPGIWYRSGDGCPDGQAFLERLSPRGVHAQLASVGDRVDFVVTLGASETGYAGRLERQTSGGVVAIREFDARTCEEVADALAVTLTLSNTPEAAPDSGPAPTPATDPPITVAPQPERPSAEALPVASAVGPSPRSDQQPGASSRRADGAWSLGAQGLVLGGVAPTLLPSIGPFLERAFAGSGVLVPTLRLTGLVGRTTGDTYAGDLEVGLLVARLEACPMQLASEKVTLRICLGVDGGWLQADLLATGGQSASGGWFSLVAHPRLAWRATSSLAIDAHAGISVPVTHHEVVLTQGPALYETANLGFQAGIALAYHWE
jgi:hypothetical protein